jgi:carbon-monoxide dehydrogenase medium subunit
MYQVLQSFEFFEPETVEEAVRLLSKYGDKVKILAGGVDLVHKMRLRQLQPEYLVSLQRISGLDYVKSDTKMGLRIGASTNLRSIELSSMVRNGYETLCEGVNAIASVQIKNMGTLVGNLCAATPATDIAPPLYVLGAKLRVVGAGTKKDIPIESFAVGVGKTALKPHEMVVEVIMPGIPLGSGGAFLKVGKTKADIAKVNAAAMITITNDSCKDVKIALGSVAPTVIRATKAEEVLKGQRIDESLLGRASEAAAEEAKPISDIRSTAAYRKHMVKVLVRDALKKALGRAGKVRQENRDDKGNRNVHC